MLKLKFQTGTAFLKVVEVEGTLNDDLMAIIDGYVQENKEDFQTFEFSKLWDDELTDEENETYIDDFFLPINGGEFYIHTIVYIDEC